MKHGQRGQVLPLWIVAILTTFAFTFLSLNYGNQIRMQIRAQNAADAAAQALLAIQTERWNMMTAMLYASSVEEYRIRHILDGILLAENGAGGCDSDVSKFDTTGGTTCSSAYTALVAQYQKAVNRYTNDVMLLNDVTTPATIDNWTADANTLFTHLKARCNTSSTMIPNNDGGDCGFQYTLNGTATRSAQTTKYGLDATGNDAYVVLVPTQGHKTTLYGVDTENAKYFAPPMVDVVVCTKVLPLIPTFWGLGAKPYYAVGRAGATAQIFENDWLQPGQLIDPARPSKTRFQPVEQYAQVNFSGNYDWYGTDFGGNTFKIVTYIDPATGKQQSGYSAQLQNNELSAFAAWWSSIPIDPRDFDKAPVDLTKTCPA
jgi:hypothetical protein